MNAASYILSTNADSNSTALIAGAEIVSYSSLQDRTSRARSLLLDSSVKTGDRVVLISDNSPFWVTAYLATLGIGAICVPLPDTLPSDHLAAIIAETSPKAAFIQSKYKQKLNPLLPDAMKVFTEDDLRSVQEIHVDSVAMPPDAIACLMYTSGTTGTPRGVMVTHRNLIANTSSILEYLPVTASDRIMVVLPFHYCYGASLLHTHLRKGATLVLNNQFMFPDKVLRQMQETKCTGFAGVPAHFQILLRRSSFCQMQFPDLRYIQQAGGKLAFSFLEELVQFLPHAKIFVMYGQTEATARLSFLSPEQILKKPGSIGKAIPGVTLQVLSNDGIPVAPGEVGEIVAVGENITPGYWNDPEATSKTFHGGRLFTGDLATVDEEGYITIVDRAKDFLKCGGIRVASKAIEDEVLKFPAVVEAAVIGIPDDVQGEAPKLFVVPVKEETDLRKSIQEFCVQSFLPHMIPKEIIFLKSLPKNASGKVDKARLREL